MNQATKCLFWGLDGLVEVTAFWKQAFRVRFISKIGVNEKFDNHQNNIIVGSSAPHNSYFQLSQSKN